MLLLQERQLCQAVRRGVVGRARRREPYPYTWEIPAAALMGLILVVALGTQLGRAVACWLSGDGLVFPDRSALVTSLPALLMGHADAGLPAGSAERVGVGLLRWSVAFVDAVVLVAAGWVAWWAMQRWGPWRLQGMASREEAQRLLGPTRLRKAAPVVRPDLRSKAAGCAEPSGRVRRPPTPPIGVDL